MTPTPALIRQRFPGVFDAVSDDSLNMAIVAAQNQLNRIAFGASADEATFLLACHFAELGKPSRAGGQHHARAGLVEIDFGRTTGETAFGQLFEELKKRRVLRIGLA